MAGYKVYYGKVMSVDDDNVTIALEGGSQKKEPINKWQRYTVIVNDPQPLWIFFSKLYPMDIGSQIAFQYSEGKIYWVTKKEYEDALAQ